MVKNPLASARDTGLIPEPGRFLGGGNGNPLWYSYLENPMDRGAWQATVHRVAKSQTKQLFIDLFKIYMNKEFSGGPVVTKTQGFHCQVGSLVCKLRSCKVRGEAKINKIKHT